MKYLKSYEQFDIKVRTAEDIIDESVDHSELLEVLEGLFSSNSGTDKSAEIKKLLEPLNYPTLKKFVDAALDNKKMDTERILKVLKQVFLSSQGWTKNKHKYNFFKEEALKAIEDNDDASWKRVIGLLDFAMKNGLVATPAWSEKKKAWYDKAKPGSVGL